MIRRELYAEKDYFNGTFGGASVVRQCLCRLDFRKFSQSHYTIRRFVDLADTPILVTLKEQTPGKADVTFEPGTDAPFTLKDIPVQLFKGKAKTSPDSLNISIVPIINSGNGRTFYLIETGDADGCVLVSYHDGTFTKAFEASSVPGNWKDANIAVTAKKLVLDLIDSKGAVTEYQLAYDKKSNTFYPVPMQVEI